MNTITIGIRSDGQFALTSSPNTAGPVPAHTFIFPRDTAVWIARELLRLAGQASPTSGAEDSK